MTVTAAAKAVMMALLHSQAVGCTSSSTAMMCSGCFRRCYNSLGSTRASTCRWLLPPAGTTGARTMTVLAAAAGEPSSRRRRGKAPTAQQQLPQQREQHSSKAAPEQTQAAAASVHQCEQMQEQQQQQQQQQMRSRQLLWDTAAQLGLKRGSEVAPPDGTDGAGSDLASDSSSSRAASSSRRRRSRASSSSSSSSSSVGRSSNSRPDVGTADASSSIEADGRSSIDKDDDSVSDGIPDSFGFSSRDDAVVAAIARLGRFLDFRERCAREVLVKLGTLGYEQQLCQRVLQELQAAGLQSDARFAEMFVRGSWRTKAQSPTRLVYELRSRGVAQQHIDAAMSAVFGPGRQLPGRDAANDQEEEMWEQLVEMCRRRAELTRAEPKQKRRAKLAGWLQRRGHTMSTIFRVFEALGI